MKSILSLLLLVAVLPSLAQADVFKRGPRSVGGSAVPGLDPITGIGTQETLNWLRNLKAFPYPPDYPEVYFSADTGGTPILTGEQSGTCIDQGVDATGDGTVTLPFRSIERCQEFIDKGYTCVFDACDNWETAGATPNDFGHSSNLFALDCDFNFKEGMENWGHVAMYIRGSDPTGALKPTITGTNMSAPGANSAFIECPRAADDLTFYGSRALIENIILDDYAPPGTAGANDGFRGRGSLIGFECTDMGPDTNGGGGSQQCATGHSGQIIAVDLKADLKATAGNISTQLFGSQSGAQVLIGGEFDIDGTGFSTMAAGLGVLGYTDTFAYDLLVTDNSASTVGTMLWGGVAGTTAQNTTQKVTIANSRFVGGATGTFDAGLVTTALAAGASGNYTIESLLYGTNIFDADRGMFFNNSGGGSVPNQAVRIICSGIDRPNGTAGGFGVANISDGSNDADVTVEFRKVFRDQDDTDASFLQIGASAFASRAAFTAGIGSLPSNITVIGDPFESSADLDLGGEGSPGSGFDLVAANTERNGRMIRDTGDGTVLVNACDEEVILMLPNKLEQENTANMQEPGWMGREFTGMDGVYIKGFRLRNSHVGN